MSNTKSKRIRVSYAFTKAPDPELASWFDAVIKGTDGNPDYSDLPVKPDVLKAMLATYLAVITAAIDGGQKAIAARDAQRQVVLKTMRLLGHYVEIACNDDIGKFMSSGFQPVTITRTPAQPLPPATIRKIEQGITGQLLVTITGIAKARSYELRDAVVGTGGLPGPWTSQTIAAVRNAVVFNGLLPGTTYAFQVRALGSLGFNDWCDPVTKMCT